MAVLYEVHHVPGSVLGSPLCWVCVDSRHDTCEHSTALLPTPSPAAYHVTNCPVAYCHTYNLVMSPNHQYTLLPPPPSYQPCMFYSPLVDAGLFVVRCHTRTSTWSTTILSLLHLDHPAGQQSIQATCEVRGVLCCVMRVFVCEQCQLQSTVLHMAYVGFSHDAPAHGDAPSHQLTHNPLHSQQVCSYSYLPVVDAVLVVLRSQAGT